MGSAARHAGSRVSGVSAEEVLRLLMLTLPAILTCGPMGASYMTLWTLPWSAGDDEGSD